MAIQGDDSSGLGPFSYNPLMALAYRTQDTDARLRAFRDAMQAQLQALAQPEAPDIPVRPRRFAPQWQVYADLPAAQSPFGGTAWAHLPGGTQTQSDDADGLGFNAIMRALYGI